MRGGDRVALDLERGRAVGRYLRREVVLVVVPDAVNVSGERVIEHRLALVHVDGERAPRRVAIERVRPLAHPVT